MPNVLVTGAHGFIGRHVARHLAAAGHRVAGLGHGIWPRSEAAQWGVTSWLNGDVVPANLDLLRKDFGSPDVVYHLAGGSSVGAAVLNPREDFFRTVVSTAELLDWMRRAAPDSALLAVSSAAVYGAGHDGPIPETAELRPYSPYGTHKRLMEELCRSYASGFGLRIAVARLFSVYGPGLRKQLMWDICSQLAADPTRIRLGGSGAELRDWTHVEDVARALHRLASLADTAMPIINVGTQVGTPVSAIASQFAEAWSAGGTTRPAVEFSGASRPGDPFSLVALAAPLSRLGFSWQHGLERGIPEFVEWFRVRARGAG